MKRAALPLICLALWARPALAGIEITQASLGNIFVQGEPVAIPVQADGGQLHWSARDFFGAEIASGTLGAGDGKAVIRPEIAGPGYFALDIKTDGGDEAQTAFAIVPQPKAPPADSPFGVATHFAKGWDTDIIPLIEKAGIRHVRDEQPWRKIEKDRGDYEFPPRLTAYMSALAAHHLDPLIVLVFSNPLYDDDQTPYSAEGRAGYASYARAVAQRYGAQLSAVEVWNEYNGSFCTGPCRRDRPGYYTSMLQETYKALKAVNPSLTVLGGAAVPIPPDYFRGLFERGALESMDAVVIHPYRPHPEGVEQKIESLRQLMARYGKPKPIWATEFGDTADMRKSRDNVAKYLVRMSTLLLSAKVERIYWYLLRDYQEFAGMGLLRDDKDPMGRYTPAPAYVAYATLIHELGGLSFVRREPSDPDTRVYLFANGGGEVRVAWSMTPGAAYQFASDGSVKLVTLMGGEKSLAPQNGRVTVPLDETPVYIVGKAAPAAP